MSESLRLRVFAGPNGSGKSTIINNVRNTVVNGKKVDLGIYVNADDIASELRDGGIRFNNYTLEDKFDSFIKTALKSGLIGERFSENEFLKSFEISGDKLILLASEKAEHLAQVLADYFRKQLLKEKKKFSFETVFSHYGKIDIMKEAKAAGYKVYLYFVCTENPDINVYRIKDVRVKEGGHDVPESSIRDRYLRSLSLLHPAAQETYRTYFFDNSGVTYNLFADFKLINSKKVWSVIDREKFPEWFMNYYSDKN